MLRKIAPDAFRAAQHVALCRKQRIALAADRAADLRRQVRNVSVRMSRKRRLDRAAAGVSEQHDPFDAEMRRRILDAAELMQVQHIPRDADHKQLADAGVKDPFRNHARIRAADDDRIRMLSVFRRFLADRRVAPGAIDPVPLDQPLQCVHAVFLPCFAAFIIPATGTVGKPQSCRCAFGRDPL